jgi:hypothetical protein
MTQQFLSLAANRPTVARLMHDDVLRVDAEPLLRLRAAEGPIVAAERVAVAREVIAYRRAQLATLHQACAFARLGREVRAIAEVSAPIGLTDLTMVSAHVLDCLDRNDPAALGATLSRLERLCNQAVELTSTLQHQGG